MSSEEEAIKSEKGRVKGTVSLYARPLWDYLM